MRDMLADGLDDIWILSADSIPMMFSGKPRRNASTIRTSGPGSRAIAGSQSFSVHVDKNRHQ
jgi:hypothetical protein